MGLEHQMQAQRETHEALQRDMEMEFRETKEAVDRYNNGLIAQARVH